ncbi:hypothetical protein DNTS_021761, partial [Danionella cerebrum]
AIVSPEPISPQRHFLLVLERMEVEPSCSRSVGTDLTMADIESFIREICRLKTEVVSLEAQLKEKGDKQNTELQGHLQGRQIGSVQREDLLSRGSQDSELSLTLLCFADPQTIDEHEEQKKTCLVELNDCRNPNQSTSEEKIEVGGGFVPPGGSASGSDSLSFTKEFTSTTSARRRSSVEHPRRALSINARTANHNSGNSTGGRTAQRNPTPARFVGNASSGNRNPDKQQPPRKVSLGSDRPFACNSCGKTFKDGRALKSHSSLHTGERPHGCSYCDKRFRTSSHRRAHERTHTGERRYLCSYCGKSYSHPNTFKVHQRRSAADLP